MNRPRNLVVARAKVEPVAARAKPKPAAGGRRAGRGPGRRARWRAARPGARMVQLGAYDSEEMTRRAWSRLVAANPDLLSSKSLYVERTHLERAGVLPAAGRGLREHRADAGDVRVAAGRGIDCIPVTLQ